jgi:3-hydroxyacyl-[acyl-carrier-protein] dehydratase
MHFNLVDRIIERTDTHIVTIKHVSSAEEYLQDHFPGFPVLPGVMMLESMTQAARRLLDPDDQASTPWVLTQAKALKYGSFVRPGATIRVTMTRHKDNDDGSIDFKGDVRLVEPGAGENETLPVACSGRITMRAAHVESLLSSEA